MHQHTFMIFINHNETMKSTIIAKGINSSPSMREYVNDRLDIALGHVQNSIHFITVRMSDLNGPRRGGIDKCVQIQLKLSGLPTVIVTEVGASINSAIDRAARRIERVVERSLERSYAVQPVNVPVLRRIASSHI